MPAATVPTPATPAAMIPPEYSKERWYPVARSEELIARHIVHAELLGQEIALWRDDAGRANAWENRCPHRGVRLSIGINDGIELRCRYHGWRFASGTGQCTFLPSHPTQKPASTLRTLTFPVAERFGYVWVCLGAASGAAFEARLDDRRITSLRSVFVDAPVWRVAAAFAAGTLSAAAALDGARVHWLHPVDETRTLIHAALLDVPPQADRLALLREHHARLAAIRDFAEAEHAVETAHLAAASPA